MRIVIELHEDVYDEILNEIEHAEIAGVGLGDLSKALKNGIPLPKGHGDLIDRKNVIDAIDWYRVNPQHFSIDNVIDDIKCMEFLVEADKEGEEE